MYYSVSSPTAAAVVWPPDLHILLPWVMQMKSRQRAIRFFSHALLCLSVNQMARTLCNSTAVRRQLLRYIILAGIVLQAANPVAGHAAENSLLSISTNGRIVVSSNRDSRTVSGFEAGTLKRLFEVEVGIHPEGTTFIGNSTLVACCVYGDDQIAIINTTTGEVVQHIDVFDEPYGVVSSKDGAFLFVTLDYPGLVIRINTKTWSVDAEWQVGQKPRGIALTPDEKSLFITEYLTANLIEIDAQNGNTIQTIKAGTTDNIARQLVLHPSKPKAYIPHIRSKVTAAHGNGSIFPYVGVATFDGKNAGRRTRIPMDSFRGATVVANPSEIALSPDGKQLFVAFGATNDLFVANIEDDYQEISYAATLRLGSNPRAVRVTPDGRSLLVYNALDYELVAYSLPNLKITARAPVTDHPLDEEHTLGKKLFYTALQPMSGRQWISCSSCHIDGDADGRTWQQPDGLRQTQPLNGLAWTHPLHWSADRDEVQDFEHTIQGKLMQGKGLLSGHLPDALADGISGRSKMLDALALYTNSHEVPLSPHAKHGLSESALRGQKLFHSNTTKCATCHDGAYYCDSQPGADFKRHDVGTGKDDPSELMGTAYDTPTLLGVYRSAPYLHDGSATTLHDVLTTRNTNDQHGTTSQLSPTEIGDLVEFIKALPFEDPVPAAKASGLKKTEK